MTLALLGLALGQVRGRLRRWLRLLRQPRYLVGTAFGVLYFTWFVIRPSRRVRIASVAPWLEQHGEALQVVAAVALALIVSLSWVLLAAKPKLPLTEAEVLTLTTAPLTRRQVLRYAVIKSQLRVLLSVAILSVFTARGGRLHLLPAYWALITLLDLHFKAIGLTKAAVAGKARPQRLRALGAGVAVLAAFWVLAGFELAAPWQALNALLAGAGSLPAVLAALAGSFEAGLAAWALAPFRWIPSLFFGDGLAWIGAAALLVLHDQWIVRSRVPFEEPALAHARRRAERESTRGRPSYRSASSRKRRRVPFPLPPRGAPAAAILWKNLMLTGRSPFRWFAWAAAAVLAAAVLAASVFDVGAGSFRALLFVGGSLYAAACFAGGLMFRHDLRHDLRHAEVLKSWPLSGWRLALGEVAAPVTRSLMLAGAGLAVVAAGGVGMTLAGGPATAAVAVRLFELAGLGVCLLPVVTALAAFAAACQNLLVMLFPAWAVIAARTPHRGPAATGQALLVGLGHLLAMVAGGILPALTAAAAFFVLRLLGGPLSLWHLPWLGLAAAAVLAAEAAFVLGWVGKLWDDLDASQELLEG